jgi:hypothetical protein
MAEAIGTFLDTLYKQQEGYVYAPTLDRELSKEEGWTTKFYKWPEQRQSLIEHAQNNTKKLEIYLGPALYKSNTLPVKDNIKGSNVVWAEFDGIAPQYNESIPNPSMWLDSSKEENHTHVYWALESFCTDAEQIENINRALTYNLGADSGGWDSTQVLRMPLTINHKRKQFTSEVNYNKAYDLLSTGAFAEIKPPVDDVNATFDRTKIPADINQVAWAKLLSENGYRLFIKKVTDLDDRSNSLMALAFFMAEQKNGLTNEEMYGVLYNADERWGKFRDRKDREKRLIDIVIKARQKYPLSGILVDNLDTLNFSEVIKDVPPVKWAIPGLLEENGIGLLTSEPGVGKTQMSLQLAIHLALGEKFLLWDIKGSRKILFLSLEMGLGELGAGEPPKDHNPGKDEPIFEGFLYQMAKEYTSPEQKKLLDENFFIVPVGYGISIDEPEGLQTLTNLLDANDYDGVFIDNLGRGMSGELENSTAIRKFIQVLDTFRRERNLFFWLIHHNRKASVGNSNPDKQSDVFGSQYISAGITAGLNIKTSGKKIKMRSTKLRYTPEFNNVSIERGDNLSFSLSDKIDTSALLAKPEEKVDGDDKDSKEFTVDLG